MTFKQIKRLMQEQVELPYGITRTLCTITPKIEQPSPEEEQEFLTLADWWKQKREREMYD